MTDNREAPEPQDPRPRALGRCAMSDTKWVYDDGIRQRVVVSVTPGQDVFVRIREYDEEASSAFLNPVKAREMAAALTAAADAIEGGAR